MTSIARRILQKLTEADHSKTAFSCFLFEGVDDPEELHVTHKYFGELNPLQISQVGQILDKWFKTYPFKNFTLKFDTEKYFGEDKDTRVLTPSFIKKDEWGNLALNLKSQLDQFRKDDYPNYEPHVTTNLPVVDRPLVKYVFVSGNKILREYKAE